jgi:hypothetical protein
MRTINRTRTLSKPEVGKHRGFSLEMRMAKESEWLRPQDVLAVSGWTKIVYMEVARYVTRRIVTVVFCERFQRQPTRNRRLAPNYAGDCDPQRSDRPGRF